METSTTSLQTIFVMLPTQPEASNPNTVLKPWCISACVGEVALFLPLPCLYTVPASCTRSRTSQQITWMKSSSLFLLARRSCFSRKPDTSLAVWSNTHLTPSIPGTQLSHLPEQVRKKLETSLKPSDMTVDNERTGAEEERRKGGGGEERRGGVGVGEE
eukprot:365674-Hanusia_phi.AAC.1